MKYLARREAQISCFTILLQWGDEGEIGRQLKAAGKVRTPMHLPPANESSVPRFANYTYMLRLSRECSIISGTRKSSDDFAVYHCHRNASFGIQPLRSNRCILVFFNIIFREGYSSAS